MRHLIRLSTVHYLSIILVLLCSPVFNFGQPKPDLKAALEGHQCFQLRDAVRRPDNDAPMFYRGAVAAAFHDSKQAEVLLSEVIVRNGSNPEADSAREMLTYVYFRSGRYRKALRLVDDALAAKPGDASLQGFRALLAALAVSPDMSVPQHRYSKLLYHSENDNIFLPVLINGQRADYILDSGANISIISESEAKSLGLTVHDAGVNTIGLTGAAGGQAGYRIAVAKELSVGDFQVRNVPFLVLNDDRQPFASLPLRKRAVLGIPLFLVFESVRWGQDGTFEVSLPGRTLRPTEPNLCFDGATPIVAGEFQGKRRDFVFDMGSEYTEFWPPFAREFEAELRLNAKGSHSTVTGLDGSKEFDSLELPELKLRVGSFDLIMKTARVLLQGPGTDSQYLHGRIGTNALLQAKTVTIDFRTMVVRLE